MTEDVLGTLGVLSHLAKQGATASTEVAAVTYVSFEALSPANRELELMLVARIPEAGQPRPDLALAHPKERKKLGHKWVTSLATIAGWVALEGSWALMGQPHTPQTFGLEASVE